MKAIQFLKWCRDEARSCPGSQEGGRRGEPSNAELRRWLQKGSVEVNLGRPAPGDKVQWPIRELVFFPEGRWKTTVILHDSMFASCAADVWVG